MPNNEPNAGSHITVVGIGASAGGIDALRTFFATVPPDLGHAYVVVVHLAPDYESELASILGRSTKMSVVEVRDNQEFELKPNCVYVIAPDRKLVTTAKTIAAASFDDLRERRAAIDVFFRSLAENHGDRVVRRRVRRCARRARRQGSRRRRARAGSAGGRA
jgi:two-component system, chemotaxis family, CheB/CheR fusion protein